MGKQNEVTCIWCDVTHPNTKAEDRRVNGHCKCSNPTTKRCPIDDLNEYCPRCGAWQGEVLW